MISHMRLFTVVVDVTRTPEIPLRPISLRGVPMNPFFVEVENKCISQYVAMPIVAIYMYNIFSVVLLGSLGATKLYHDLVFSSELVLLPAIILISHSASL
ncbi:hypothetical protein GIB67_035599, partial [Kingdonia uniflora]